MPRLLLVTVLFAISLSARGAPPTDQQGEPLPAGAVARFGSARLLHGPLVEVLRFSADGKCLISNAGGQVRQWDGKTGQLLSHVSIAEHSHVHAQLSDNCLLYTTFQDETIRLLDMRTGKTSPWPHAPKGSSPKVISSPDNRLITLADAEDVIQVHEASGKRLARFEQTKGKAAWPMAFSADGALLAMRHGEEASVWDIRRQKRLATVKLAEKIESEITMAFSPDGRYLAVAWDIAVRVFDARTLVEQEELCAPMLAKCHGIAFSADSKDLIAVTTATEGEILRWSIKERDYKRLGAFAGEDPTHAFSADAGLLALGGNDGQIRVFDLRTNRERSFAGRQPPLVEVLCTAPSTVTVLSEDGQVVFWNLKDGREVRRQRFARSTSITLSPDGKYAAWYDDARLIVHDIATAKRLLSIANTSGKPIFSPDGTIMLTGEGVRRQLWNVARRTLLREIELHGVAGALAVFAPDGRTIACASDFITITEVATGRMRDSFYRPRSSIKHSELNHLRYSGDGKTLVLSREHDLAIFSTGTADPLHQFPNERAPSVLTISPDGRWLATVEFDGGFQNVSLRDLRSPVPVRAARILTGHEGDVTALDFTSDGAYLVSASKDGTALVWDVARFPVAVARPAPPPDEKQLANWWSLLGAANPQDAGEPLRGFERYPALAIPFFKARLRPGQGPPPGRVAALIRDLDAKKFADRQQATRELEKLGELPEPELEAVMDGKPTLEMATRIENLLKKIHEPITDADRLREVRAVEVLEKIGTVEARALLEALAKGHPGARLTREAKSSLERWPKR